MRILQIHNRYRYAGGEDAVVESEAEVLRSAGHNVHQHISSNPTSDLKAAGNLILAPWNPGATRRLNHVLDETDPDVAHVHNTWFSLSPAILRTLHNRKIPAVLTLHNFRLTCANGLLLRDGKPCQLCVGNAPWPAVRYGCYRNSRLASLPAAATIQLHHRLGTWVNDVDVFIALTDVQSQIMIRAGLPEEKVVLKPHFVPDPGGREMMPSQSDVILFAGRLSVEKGVYLLIEAWRKVRPNEFELVIAGDGPERASLESDLPAGVRMVGQLSPGELAQVMLTARAMVMPSLWYEGLPRALLEAFAAGLPCAVSDGGGPAEIVTRTIGSDWVFPMGDRSSLAHMLLAMRNDEWCNAASLVARHAFKTSYDRNQAAGGLVEIYDRAISVAASNNGI